MIRWTKRKESLSRFSLFIVARSFQKKKSNPPASDIAHYNKICSSVKSLRVEIENKAPREKIVKASVEVATDALMLIYNLLFNANEYRNNT